MKTQTPAPVVALLSASVATLIERNDWLFEQRLVKWIDSGRSKRASAKWTVRCVAVFTPQGHQEFKTFTAARAFAAVCRRSASLGWAIHQSVAESVSGCCVLSIYARVGIPGGQISVQ